MYKYYIIPCTSPSAFDGQAFLLTLFSALGNQLRPSGKFTVRGSSTISKDITWFCFEIQLLIQPEHIWLFCFGIQIATHYSVMNSVIFNWSWFFFKLRFQYFIIVFILTFLFILHTNHITPFPPAPLPTPHPLPRKSKASYGESAKPGTSN